MAAGRGAGIPRRRVLAGLLLVPPALALGACAGPPARPAAPDPLIPLAAAATADAAQATAAIAADAALAERLQPLVDARIQHAAALHGEVARLRPSSAAPTLARVRDAARVAAAAAAAAALDLPADRIGLVASVAACCGTYAAVLA